MQMIEAVIKPHKLDAVKTALKLSHVRGVVLLAIAEAGMPLGEYSPLEIKTSVVGYGRAEKQQVKLMVHSLLRLEDEIESEDACDALALLGHNGAETQTVLWARMLDRLAPVAPPLDRFRVRLHRPLGLPRRPQAVAEVGPVPQGTAAQVHRLGERLDRRLLVAGRQVCPARHVQRTHAFRQPGHPPGLGLAKPGQHAAQLCSQVVIKLAALTAPAKLRLQVLWYWLFTISTQRHRHGEVSNGSIIKCHS